MKLTTLLAGSAALALSFSTAALADEHDVIADDMAVSINYLLVDEDGNELDSSADRGAMWYLHGHQNIIPGLEAQLDGLSEGDEFTATVAPEDAYGERREDLVQEVPIENFPDANDIEVGMTFFAQSQQGPMQVEVVAVGDDMVTVDANHQLAGMTLEFSGSVESVRAATEEEIQNGMIADSME